MYAIRLTSEEFAPYIENLEGDRRIEAYAIEPITYSDGDMLPTVNHSLIISGTNPQG